MADRKHHHLLARIPQSLAFFVLPCAVIDGFYRYQRPRMRSRNPYAGSVCSRKFLVELRCEVDSHLCSNRMPDVGRELFAAHDEEGPNGPERALY